MDRDAFHALAEDVVEDVLRSLASDLGERLENVEISVEDWPSEMVLREVGVAEGTTLFGLYQGVPKTERSFFHAGSFPDRITLYQGPIQEGAATPREIRDRLRRTVLHEIAHHFGISDERLLELNAY